MATSVFSVRSYCDFSDNVAGQIVEQTMAITKRAIAVKAIDCVFNPKTQVFRVSGDYKSAEIFAGELLTVLANEIKLKNNTKDKSSDETDGGIREGNFAVWNHEDIPWTIDADAYKKITGSIPTPIRDRSRYSLSFEWHPKKVTDLPRFIQQMGTEIKKLEDAADCMVDIDLEKKKIVLKAYSSDAIDTAKEKLDSMQDSYNKEWKNRDLHIVIPVVKSSFHLQFVNFAKQKNIATSTIYSKVVEEPEKLFSIRLLEYNPAQEKFQNKKVEVNPVFTAPPDGQPSPPWPAKEFKECGIEPCPPMSAEDRMAHKLRAALTLLPREPEDSPSTKPQQPSGLPPRTTRKVKARIGRSVNEGNLVDFSTDTDLEYPSPGFLGVDLNGPSAALLDAKSPENLPVMDMLANKGIWGASSTGNVHAGRGSTWGSPVAPSQAPPPASSTPSSARWSSTKAGNLVDVSPQQPTSTASTVRPPPGISRAAFSLGVRPSTDSSEPERIDTPGPPGGVPLPTRKVRTRKTTIMDGNEYHDTSRQQQRRVRRDEESLEEIMEHNMKEITRNLKGGLTRARKHKGFLALKIELGRVIFDGLPKNVSKGDFPWGELDNTLDSIKNTYTTRFITKLSKHYYDIEFIAGLKLGKGQPMFSGDISERVTFEFNCVKGDEKMTIVFDADSSSYEVRGRTIDYSSAYMSYPTQNWDARISVEGYSFYDKHSEPFRSFVKNLYM
ncbi:hypothetical protein BJ508DRAFT_143225 [Ascobolus immersus RN42]|uniref:DUF7905 domain-containing protein n=1 Tax=Ascobolus immersus RN42 TaxID=1160509 RepID=A0A3N4IC11_ASCIM|nr:hypothetical protein BJ508DRAFT_143225 [Ascobolus immersus RN42]